MVFTTGSTEQLSLYERPRAQTCNPPQWNHSTFCSLVVMKRYIHLYSSLWDHCHYYSNLPIFLPYPYPTFETSHSTCHMHIGLPRNWRLPHYDLILAIWRSMMTIGNVNILHLDMSIILFILLKLIIIQDAVIWERNTAHVRFVLFSMRWWLCSWISIVPEYYGTSFEDFCWRHVYYIFTPHMVLFH